MSRPWEDVPDGMKDIVERCIHALKHIRIDRIKVSGVTHNITSRGESETNIDFMAITPTGVYDFRVSEKRRMRPEMPMDMFAPEKLKFERKAKKKVREKKEMNFLEELKKV